MRWIVPAFVLLAACSAEQGTGSDEAKFQADLSAASEQAREKLPYYWEHFDAPEIDEYDFTVKVALPRRDGQPGAEDVWLENIARDDETLQGQLMIDPKSLGELREGAIVEFEEEQIVDWAFLRGEELIGHYTTRVMLPRMDPQQAEGLRSMFGENPK